MTNAIGSDADLAVIERRKLRVARINNVMEAVEEFGGTARFGDIRAKVGLNRGALDSTLKMLVAAGYLIREHKYIVEIRRTGPRNAFFYSTTPLGHQQLSRITDLRDWENSVSQEYQDRKASYWQNWRVSFSEGEKATVALHMRCLLFIKQTVDRGSRGYVDDTIKYQKYGPIEFRFRGHHYYDPSEQRYIA